MKKHVKFIALLLGLVLIPSYATAAYRAAIPGLDYYLASIDLATNITGVLGLTNGGTDASNAQSAINNLTQVSGATNEHVLTKDTASGNAIFKAAPAGVFSDSGTTAYQTDLTDAAVFGGVSAINSSRVTIDGVADQTQLLIQSHSTQTPPPILLEKSDGTDVFSVSNTGEMTLNGTGSATMNLGAAADPTMVFNTLTAGDLDAWAGVQENAGGTTAGDLFEIGAGSVAGTTPWISFDVDGNVDLMKDLAILRLPRKSTSGDSTGATGAIQYNSNVNKFRVYENAAWKNMMVSGAVTNTTYLGTGDDINTAITAATAGDTLVLAAGTYTVTSNVVVSKSLTIIGAGRNLTKISTGSGATVTVSITASNVTIKNLTVAVSGSTSNYGIFATGTAGTVLTNVILDNVEVSIPTATNSEFKMGVRYDDAGGIIKDLFYNGGPSNANSGGNGIFIRNNSTAEAATAVHIFNPHITVSCGTGTCTSQGITVSDNSATVDAVVSVYGGYATATSGGSTASGALSTGGANAILRMYGTTLSGGNYDADQASSGSITLYNAQLVNGTTNGTITYAGANVTGSLAASGDITSSDTGNIGWTPVDGTDNTTGDSQCTSACVVGVLNATGTAVTGFVACTDATADSAICAGAS